LRFAAPPYVSFRGHAKAYRQRIMRQGFVIE
jgi:hypothetical protein